MLSTSITHNSMIFKTIRQSLEDVYIAGRKINELNNLKLNATNITAYATALKGLNAKQAELVLSTQGLTIAQKQAILSQAELLGSTGKLTTAELNAILVTKKRNKDQAEALLINTGLITSETAEATATNVVTAAKLKELVATGKLTQAEANLIAAKAGVTLANQKESASFLAGIGTKIKGAGTALKGLGTGILTIAQAHPVIAGITAALALCGGAALVNKVKQEKAAKAIKEAYEEAKNAINEINNTFSENSSKTKEIAKEYAELAQGVNLLTNENKNLSTEKYERFLELSNQLSTLYPSLTKNFDENGVAILDLSGDVDTIVGSLDDLIERQRVLANQEIMKQMPDLFAGYSNNVADLKEQKEDAKKTRDEIQRAYEVLNSWDGSTVWRSNGGQVAKGADNAIRSLSDYTNALDALGIKYKKVAVDLDNDPYHNNDGFSIEADYKQYGSELSDIYVSAFNKASDDVKYAEQQFEAETSSINQYLNTWLQTEFSYNQIEDSGLQKAIQDTLFNFDWSNLPEGIDKNDWKAVSEYLRRNILFSINNINDSDVSEALANIYSGSLNSGELLEAIAKVQEYFGSEHPFSINLQAKVDDTQPLINNVKEKLQDDFDDKVGELTLEELHIAAEQVEVPEGTLLSWDELIAKIKEVQDSTSNNPPMSFSETVEQLDQMKDKFSALDSVMSKLYDKDSSIGFDEYSSIIEAFKDVEGLDITSYIKQLQDAGQNVDQVKSVIGSLIDEYLSLTGVLDNVNEENYKLITLFLEENGVENAESIITEALSQNMAMLAAQKAMATDASFDLETATAEDIDKLIEETKESEETKQALALLAFEKQSCNDTLIMTDGDIENLKALAKQAGLTQEAIAKIKSANSGLKTTIQMDGDGKKSKQFKTMLGTPISEKAKYNGGSDTQKQKASNSNNSDSKSKKDEKEKDIMSELNSEMDKYQSKLKAVKEARETYNQHGKISVDQAQDILDADFKLLAAYGDEETALKDLGKVKLNEMQIQLARNAIDTINNIKTEAEATQYLAGANENLVGTSLSATEALLQQVVAAAKLRGTMQGLAADTILKGYQNGAMMLGQVDFSLDTSELQKTSLDKFKDWFSTLFDWIETKLENQTKKIERYIKRAESRMNDGKYSSAAEWYKKAISASAAQSGYQQEASKKYKEQANNVLKKAIDEGIVSQDEANSIAYNVKNGTMDISEYSDEIKEVISAYKEWYEKSREASEAIEDLHGRIREYVKALKDVRDAHRDAKIDSLELFATIGTSTIANTLGMKNDHLYYQDVQLYRKNTAYDNAVKNVGKDTNSLGKDAKSSINAALKSSSNKKYKNALNHANKAIKAKKPVSDADLKVIKKYSIETYNKLYAYNEALDNLDSARLEQATNYAATSAEIMSNRDEKLANRRQSRLDDIDLLNQKSNNAQSAAEANKFLDQAAAKYDTVAGNANVAIEKRKGIIKETSSAVSSKKGTTAKYKTLESDDNKRKLVNKYIKEAKSAVKSKTPIKASTLAGLSKYYSEGYITKSFYESCVDYNNAIESKKQLELQKEIDEETAKAEKAAIGTQKVNNVEQEYTNQQTSVSDKTSMITAKQDTKTTRGLSLNASDYNDLLAQNKSSKSIYDSEIIALRKVIEENLASGYWTTASQEYLDAMSALHGYEVKAQECVTEQERLNNEIAQLPYDAFEKALELLDAIAANNKSAIDLKAAKSEDLSEADYLRQISDNNDQIKKLEEERRQAFADYQKALANPDGVYGGKTAEQWKERYLSIGTEINNTLSENEQLKDSLRDDVYWRPFNRMKEALERLKGVLEGINNLLSDDMMFDSKGDLTDYGISKIALLAKEYENARDVVQNYADGIANLNKLYAENYYSDEEYKEKLAEMQTGILSSASDMKSVMGQIIDMYKTMAQTELDELFKLIDARNDALSAKKAYYDYDKTIRDKTKDIQSLKSQIAALEGIDTSEAKAKRATLQAQLSEAQEDLDDTVNDHMLELSQDALNDLKDTLQDAFDDKWEHIGGNLEEITKLIACANTIAGSSASAINGTLQNLLQYYGIDIEESEIQNTLLNEQIDKTRQELKDTIESHSLDLSTDTMDGIKDVIHETFDDKLSNITEDLNSIAGSGDKLDKISENIDNIAKSDGKLDKIHMTIDEFKKYMIAKSENRATSLEASTIVIKPDSDQNLSSGINNYVRDSGGNNTIPYDIQDMQRFTSGINAPVSTMSVRTGDTNITQHYDSLIKVEGNVDKYVVDDVKKLGSDLLKDPNFMKGTYEYTSKEIVRDARRVGIKA